MIKKSNAVFNFCKIVLHSSLWLKLSIFFSLVLFSLEMHNRSGKKLIEKKLNVDRQLFKDVLCVTLLQEGGGAGPILRKNCHHFPYFHLSTPPLKWTFLYIPSTPFYSNPVPARPPPFWQITFALEKVNSSMRV